MLTPNPPWVTKALADSFETMEERVPSKWLPRLSEVKAKRGTVSAKMKEYGCGSYGCVLPTLDPGTVLKVTTDQTEAQFATDISHTLAVKITVDYRLAMELAGKHLGNTIYLLWRESAEDVGGFEHPAIDVQHKAAESAYIEMHKTGTTTRAAMRRWMDTVEAMAKVPELEFLARGLLRVYNEQGVFFGDIHAGNLGRVVRDGELKWVVIDPGHISVIR